MIKIRPFDKEKDHPGRVAIFNLLNPDSPSTEEDARREDEARPSRLHFGDFIAEKDGKVVGTGFFGQSEGRDYHPQKFGVWIIILPDYQRQGIGTALYYALLEAMAPHHPIEISVGTYENWDSCVQFLQKLGFVEAWRQVELHLDVAGFDPNILQGTADKVMASGITIRTCADLIGDPERDRKIYELHCRTCDDMPFRNPFIHLSFEDFTKKYLQEDSPNALPDAWFIAIDNSDSANGTYIGLATLTKPSEGDYLYTQTVGVLSPYRGQGIASALKLRTVLYAKEKNVQKIVTTNAQTNRAMLAINEKMGFVKQSAWVDFKKDFAEEVGQASSSR
jgi:mycothiol synthase